MTSKQEYDAAWYQRNADAKKAQRARIRAENKRLVIEAYGGKCTCCGETEPLFLVVDHVNDDGARHREEIGQGVRKIGSGSIIHAWLVKNGFPEGFQLLCANCNTAKQSGGCPHVDGAR